MRLWATPHATATRLHATYVIPDPTAGSTFHNGTTGVDSDYE